MSDGIGLTIAKLKIERDELRAQQAETDARYERVLATVDELKICSECGNSGEVAGKHCLNCVWGLRPLLAAKDRELAALRAIEDSGHDATIHYRKGQWVVGIWINGREDLRKVKADRGHFFDAVTAALAAAPAEEDLASEYADDGIDFSKSPPDLAAKGREPVPMREALLEIRVALEFNRTALALRKANDALAAAPAEEEAKG